GVTRDGERLCPDFPARPPSACRRPAAIDQALGLAPPRAARAGHPRSVRERAEPRALAPRMEQVAALDTLGVIATAPGRDADFVSRFFAPRAGVPEDPVTGSARCTLILYPWQTT